MPTPDRFEHAERCLADCRPLQAGAALTRHQALYVNHLRIARHLETWAREMDAAQGLSVRDAGDQGFAAGLRAVATYLRRGTYVYLPEPHSCGAGDDVVTDAASVERATSALSPRSTGRCRGRRSEGRGPARASGAD